MTLKTLGMGIAKVITKSIKKAKKTDAPLYGVVGVAVGGRQVYNKITGKQSDWEGIKEARKKNKKRRRDESLHKGEK